jgi:hypothetical protein
MSLHGSCQTGRFRQETEAFQRDVAPLPRDPAGRAVLTSGTPCHALAAPGEAQGRR